MWVIKFLPNWRVFQFSSYWKSAAISAILRKVALICPFAMVLFTPSTRCFTVISPFGICSMVYLSPAQFITPFRVLPRRAGTAHCPVLGLPVRHEHRGGVSPDICKFIAQGTVQLFATASHRLDVAANIESIYWFFKRFRTFLLPPKNEQSSHKKHRSYHAGR